MKRKLKHSLNANEFPKRREDTTAKPSMTIPDQSLSVAEIMRRYTKGIPLGAVHKTPIFNGDEDLPDFDKMDMAEREEFMEHNKAELHLLQARFRKEQAELHKKEQKRLEQPPKAKNGDSEEEPESPKSTNKS